VSREACPPRRKRGRLRKGRTGDKDCIDQEWTAEKEESGNAKLVTLGGREGRRKREIFAHHSEGILKKKERAFSESQPEVGALSKRKGEHDIRRQVEHARKKRVQKIL